MKAVDRKKKIERKEGTKSKGGGRKACSGPLTGCDDEEAIGLILPSILAAAFAVPGSCVTDVLIIELSISSNYQTWIKIIHLMVNIKHIISLMCVLGEVCIVKHGM